MLLYERNSIVSRATFKDERRHIVNKILFYLCNSIKIIQHIGKNTV